MHTKDKRGKIIVRLTRSDIAYLRRIARSGARSAQVITRARVLLMSHHGKRNREIIDALGCTHFAVADIRKRYVNRKKDVARAIIDAPRPGQPRRILPEHEAYVVATACTDPPEGHAHWTLLELNKALLVAYQTIRTVSDERIRQILLAHELKPWREKMWCIPKPAPEFRERMDDILALYTEPLPEGHEVHCMDETPKRLLGTPHGSIPSVPGRHRRVDYEYERRGRVNIFVAVAPFAGTRTVRVTDRRTAEDTASFLWDYCMTRHKDAAHIDLVADNLNTHKEKLLRKTWGPERSEAFFSRVTIRFTPPHGSWLNLAELEINRLKTQGLKRRIPTKDEIIKVAASIVAARNQERRTISWSFTKAKAREKFPALYAGD